MQTTVTIDFDRASHPAPLFHRYPRQTSPQHAYVTLRDGVLTAAWDAEIGNAVPMDVWHGRAFRWRVSNKLHGGQVAALLADVLPLAQRVWDGLSVEWDGANHVGALDDDAQEAHDEIQRMCEDALGDAQVWDVGSWLENSDAADLRAYGDSVAEISAALESEATEQGIVLDGDVQAAVNRILDAAMETATLHGWRVRYDPTTTDAGDVADVCADADDEGLLHGSATVRAILSDRPDLHGTVTLREVLAALGAELLDAE